MKNAFILILLVLLLCGSGKAQESVSKEEDVITLCELMKHWEVYDRHTIRVRAVFGSGAEQMWLSDPECGDGETVINFEIHSDAKKDVLKEVKELTNADHSDWLVFEGIFFGPEPFDEIDPKLPEPIRQRLAKDSFDASLKVLNIISLPLEKQR
jgi:hypothetical protein